VGLGCPLFSTQNESDGWVLAGLHPVFTGIVQIKVHLPILMLQAANLEVD
jgi:hypothetical protein